MAEEEENDSWTSGQKPAEQEENEASSPYILAGFVHMDNDNVRPI